MEVREPVFVLGTGRCGSTALHRILCQHTRVSWLCHFVEKRPGDPWLNGLVMRGLGIPLVRDLIEKSTYPTEGYRFWHHHTERFARPGRDLTADDVSAQAEARLRRAASHLISPSRDRLLLKLTGWPRIGFLAAVFPDARFVLVKRDGRAVAYSGARTPWFETPDSESWPWGPLDPERLARWERYDRSPLVLSALVWEILMDAQEKAKREVSASQLVELRYEELCEDPVGRVRRVIEFAGLSWDRRFERRLRRIRLENRNHKWRAELSDEQKRALCDVLGSALRRHGYA